MGIEGVLQQGFVTTSADKRLVWLERGGHIATEDYDKAVVFEETLRFIQSHAHQPS